MKTLLLIAIAFLGGVMAYTAYHQDKGVNKNVVQNNQTVPFDGNRTELLKTNAWFSSVYKGLPTASLFALPGAYQFDETGLAISFPRAVGTPNTVFGSFDRFCSVGMESKITKVTVARYGDWDALFEIESGSAPWQVHMAQGSPVVALDNFQGQMVVSCKDDIQVSSVDRGIMVKRGAEAMLIQAKGTFSLEKDAASAQKVKILSSEKSYRIILIPQQTEKSLEFFVNLPWNNILDTYADYRQDGENIRAEYIFRRSQENEPILTTLWPHHRLDSGDHQEILGEYKTSTGILKLIETKSFVTTSPAPALSLDFKKVTDPRAVEIIRDAVRKDVAALKTATPPEGVYFFGTWLGGVASVAQLAHLYGMDAEKHELLDILQNHLTSGLKNFSYREDLSMLVAKNTEFGNDQGNDHHFHYGYYLRAASVLVSLRPELRPEMEPMVNELALDIATTDRASTRYPYIRNFSPYDGHSWADGYALFADGNDQESTSEALNAWYGLWMWGKVTNSQSLQDTGITLFSIELAATKAYWFGENNPFPEGYTHTIASLVWGGKRDYATWFSGQAMHIHGIQWLPITPASQYLQTLPNFPLRKAEVVRAHPSPATHEWGDLYAAVLSYSDPSEALTLLPLAVKNQAIKSTALLYQTVYQNLEKIK